MSRFDQTTFIWAPQAEKMSQQGCLLCLYDCVINADGCDSENPIENLPVVLFDLFLD